MARAGPRCKEQEQPSALQRRDRMPLRRIESDERPNRALDGLTVRLDPHRPLHDDKPRALLHLVLAQFLSGLQPDQHCTGFVLRAEDHRRAAPAGCLDVAQVPTLHRIAV